MNAIAAPPTIDVHTHLAPAPPLKAGCVHLDEGGRWVVDGNRVGVPGLYDAVRLDAWLVERGVDQGWVSAPPPFYRQGMDSESTRRWVHQLDRGMRARLEPSRAQRLLTYLPLDQPGIAIELVDALGGTGADGLRVGWCAAAGGGSLRLDDAQLEPLWRRLEASGEPLLLHPGESPDRRLERFYLSNLLGNPVETAIAVADLVLGGVLAAHPGLRIVLVHCGGVVPALVGRWAQGVATARPGIGEGTQDPRAAVRSLWVDSLAHSPEVLALTFEVFGEQQVVLGSDYPFPMGVEDPFASLAHLDGSRQAAIARNAAVLTARSRRESD